MGVGAFYFRGARRGVKWRSVEIIHTYRSYIHTVNPRCRCTHSPLLSLSNWRGVCSALSPCSALHSTDTHIPFQQGVFLFTVMTLILTNYKKGKIRTTFLFSLGHLPSVIQIFSFKLHVYSVCSQ